MGPAGQSAGCYRSPVQTLSGLLYLHNLAVEQRRRLAHERKPLCNRKRLAAHSSKMAAKWSAGTSAWQRRQKSYVQGPWVAGGEADGDVEDDMME